MDNHIMLSRPNINTHRARKAKDGEIESRGRFCRRARLERTDAIHIYWEQGEMDELMRHGVK